jgi:hypothetical protein
MVIGRIAKGDEELLRAPAAADFYQSPERLSWLRRNGVEARGVIVVRGDEVVASAIFEQTGGRWFLWKGPSGPQPSGQILAAVLAACSDLCPVTLVLQPEWVHRAELYAAGYGGAGSFVTLLVRADGSEREVLGRMKPATRRQVQRGLRSGLRFMEGGALISRFYPVYAASMDAAGSPDFATLREHVSLVTLPRVRLFVAAAGDEVAAGSICFENADAFEARYVATNPACRRLGALNFLHFKTIQHVASSGRRFLDLSGIAIGPLDQKLANINRFKEGFGGLRYEYPMFCRSDRNACE